MIDRDHKLPLARQAKAVGISRGSIYYRPRPVGEAGLGLMRRIDELHLEYPFAGSRMMRGLLRQEGLSSGRRHIATLMRRMGIDALYRKPNTSRRRPGHTVYPYLSRFLEVFQPESPVGEWCLVLHFAHPSPEVGECGICRWLWRSAPGRQCGPPPPHGVRQELQGRQRPVVPTATTQMPNTGHNDYQEPRTKLQTRGR